MEYVDPPEPGVYHGMSQEEYHSIDACSNSRLKALKRSPAHLKARLEDKEEETDAMRLGSMVHCALLEPERFEKEYRVLGECEATYNNGNPCDAPAKYITPEGDFCGRHGDEENHDDSVNVVKEDQMETVEGILSSIRAKQTTSKLFDVEGHPEMVMIWDDPELGVRCKARVDWATDETPKGSLIDFKSTSGSAEPREFRRKIFRYGYDTQACFYYRGAQALDLPYGQFAFVAGETNPPYGVALHDMPESYLKEAQSNLYDAIHTYERVMEKQEFPGYPDVCHGVEIPDWAYDKLEEERDRLNTFCRELEL